MDTVSDYAGILPFGHYYALSSFYVRPGNARPLDFTPKATMILLVLLWLLSHRLITEVPDPKNEFQ